MNSFPCRHRQHILAGWRSAAIRILLAMAVILLAAPGMNTSVWASNSQPVPPSPPAEMGSPGWYTITADPVPPAKARRVLLSRQPARRAGDAGKAVAALPTSETEATPEIQALARGLQNDPKLIFDYVHNQVDYVPTFGSVNGATGTLLAGRGNDWDQASLFIALMRAAGYTANYVVGDVVYDVDRLANWVGVNNDLNIVANIFAVGGVPVQSVPAGLKVTRVWAEAVIDSTTYVFDPAMKEYRNIAGIDLGSATGYDSATFMADAQVGATVTASYTLNINEANVQTDLVAFSMNLVDYIKTNMPNATLAEVIGGRSIIPAEMSSYPTSLPYALSVSNETTYAEIPGVYRHTLRLQHEGIDRTFATYQIAGKRVTIFYRDSDGAPELRVDGEVTDTGNPTSYGFFYEMTVTVDHPYAANGGTYGDQQGTVYLRRGNAYAIIHDFEDVGPALITKRHGLLSKYRELGYADTSEAVLGESLTVMGLTWFQEARLFAQLLGRLAQVVSMQHHWVGIMGQEEGYFIDVPLVRDSSRSATGDATDTLALVRAKAMMSSAFEYGMLEQQQGSDNPAVSTIKVLQLNNSNGMKTFLANAGNWSTVKPQLVHYTVPDLNMIEAYINAGYDFVLPEDADIILNDWHGLGYIQHYQSGNTIGMAMVILGTYYGGQPSKRQQLDPKKIKDPRQRADKDGSKSTPKSDEPVDMATGVYLYQNGDLSLGQPEPMGLHFNRSYNSGDNYRLGPLGYGWSHNYELFLSFHSDWDAGLGRRQPTDAASMIVSAYVALDLLKNQLNVQGWTTTVLVTKWGMDQLIDNAVTANLGSTTLRYVELADGTYNPPPGIRRELVQNGGNYYLQRQDDTVLTFDTGGRIRAWQDSNSNRMVFAYDGAGRLETITNTLGLTLTFAYSGTQLISVTDFAGRSVSYEYTYGDLTTYQDAEGHTWRYGYDSEDRMTSVVHPLGNVVVTNVYDEQGRVETQTDALGHTTTFYFSGARDALEDADGNETVFFVDEEGRMTARQDALGHRSPIDYDGQGHLTSLSDRLGDTTQITYDDASGQIVSITNAKGDTIHYTYAPQQQSFGPVTFTVYNLTRIDYSDGTSEQFSYDAKGNLLQATDKEGRTWSYTYNARGQLLTMSNPAGGVITYTYNADGTRASSTDSDTGITTYEYDAYGRLSKINHPDGTFMQLAYDLNDQLTAITDGNNHTYTYQYDANGNLTKITDPAGNETRYSYDLMDRWAQGTDRLGKSTTLTYDAMGRLASVADPNSIQVSYGYDSRGWLDQMTLGGQDWQIGYGDEGEVASRTTPLGNTASYQTNKLGYTAGITTTSGQAVTFARDGMSRITEISDPLNRTTQYGYDPRGLLSSVTMPAIGTVVYQGNELGQITQITDLNGKNWTYGYSSMGRFRSHADPLGNTWQHTYDSRGRLGQTTYPDSSTQVRTYDGASNIVRRLYSDGTDLQFTYDELDTLVATNHLTLTRDAEGRVINAQDQGINFGAAYDDGGRLESITYDSGAFSVTYTYDAITGLLSRVADSLTGTWMDFTYDDDGRLTGINRPNGVGTSLAWDGVDQLTRIQEGSIIDIQYVRDAAGQVTQVSMTAPLNPADYLVSGKDSFSYDDASQVNSEGYTYDPRGRLTASPGHTYTWDAASRLTGIDSATLTYNGLGSLITRTEGGTTIHYYNNYAIGLTPIVAEKDQNTGQFLRYYIWTPDGNLLYMIDAADGNKVYFYHFGQVGSTLALTDSAGHVTDSYAYGPYGRLLHYEGANDQPFTYVGEYGVLQLAGMYYMRARYYDPHTARFISRDQEWRMASNPLELNPYIYAYGNPLSYIDPMGTQGGKVKALQRLGELIRGLFRAGAQRTFKEVYTGIADGVAGRLAKKVRPNKSQLTQGVTKKAKIVDILLSFIPGWSAIEKGDWAALVPQAGWDIFAAPYAATVTLPATAMKTYLEYGEPNTHGVWSYGEIYDKYYAIYGNTWGAWYTVNANTLASYPRDAISSTCGKIVEGAGWLENAVVSTVSNIFRPPREPYSLPTRLPNYAGYDVTNMGQRLYK